MIVVKFWGGEVYTTLSQYKRQFPNKPYLPNIVFRAYLTHVGNEKIKRALMSLNMVSWEESTKDYLELIKLDENSLVYISGIHRYYINDIPVFDEFVEDK